jgi:hypothetical protein
MSKIHVLPDENLGGGPNGQILREYVEVERKAKVGDYIIGCDGEIIKVTRVDGNRVGNEERLYRDWNYITLEPTDIVRIYESDDICGMYVRYRLVDRKAKVGDRIIIVDGKGWYRDKVGNIYEVIHSSKYGFEEDDDGRAYVEYEKNEYDEAIHYVRRENYRVLEAVEPAELVTAEEGDDKSVLDLLANLARRVTELERKLGLNETLLRQAQNEINELYANQRESEKQIEMILDDIVTLDERTQPLVALVKAVKADE